MSREKEKRKMDKPPPPGTPITVYLSENPVETMISARYPPEEVTGIPWRVALVGFTGLYEWPLPPEQD